MGPDDATTPPPFRGVPPVQPAASGPQPTPQPTPQPSPRPPSPPAAPPTVPPTPDPLAHPHPPPVGPLAHPQPPPPAGPLAHPQPPPPAAGPPPSAPLAAPPVGPLTAPPVGVPYPVPPPGQAYSPTPHGQPYSPGTPAHPYAPQWGDGRFQPYQSPARPGGGRRAGLWFVLGSAALLCLVSAAVIGWQAMDRGPAHPDAWDPAVLDLVDFVEGAQGTEFDHPVYVEFLEPEEYRRVAGGAADADALDEDEAAYAEQAAEDDLALYRALGLISGAPDLTAAGESLLADGTAAFYDPSEDRVVVSGVLVDGEVPLELHTVVVHELAHALQHQVSALVREDPPETTEASDALLALLEGDASVVEQEYFAQLPPEQQAQLAQAEEAQAAEAEGALAEAGVPEVLSTMFSLPYAFGPSWVAAALDGPDGVDLAEMLDGPRPTTAQILGMVPRSALEPAAEVEELEAPASAEVLYDDTWGAFSWSVAFASWVDPARTAAAVAGWDGDAVVVYVDERDRVCFDASVETSSEDGAAAFGDAVRGWMEQLPAEAGATWAIDGRSVTLSSCDPGAEVVFAPSQDLTAAIRAMATRNSIIAGTMIGGVSRDAAGCFADGLIGAFGADRLGEEALVSSPEFDRVRSELALRCRI